MLTVDDFERSFSIPREPRTARSPGQHADFEVPEGKRVMLTDIYAENLGGGDAFLEILEQRLPASFELRYGFTIKADQVLSLSLGTGLKLGDETPISNVVRVQNSTSSKANLLFRINGQLVG